MERTWVRSADSLLFMSLVACGHRDKLLCIYMFVCIYVCTHTHTPPMDERIYGYVGWDISLIQTGVRIQPHHAVSALQLPAGVHSCWALTICQGSIEACTLFPFSCPSMPRFPQGGPTVVSSPPPALDGGVLGACAVPELDVRSRHWDTGVAPALLKRRGPKSKLKDSTGPLPLLNLSLLPVSP